MVNVFVIGAGGYIGNAVAIAARRAGHKVWGLVRKTEQAEQLKINEITPVIGDISNPKSYEPIFDLVSRIIDAAGSSCDNEKILFDSIFSYAEQSPRKITLLHTSGVLVYGKQAEGTIIDEDIHIPNLAPLSKEANAEISNRLTAEEKIIKSDQLNGVVIRPGWVFGGSGGHYLDSFWSFDAKTGDYEFKGTLDKKWSFIHVVDLAALYVKILEAAPSTIAHQYFNAANDSRVKLIDIRIAMAKAAGATGKLINTAADTDPFSEVCEVSLIMSNNKAKRLLAWVPKFDFLDDIQIYYHSWKAAQK